MLSTLSITHSTSCYHWHSWLIVFLLESHCGYRLGFMNPWVSKAGAVWMEWPTGVVHWSGLVTFYGLMNTWVSKGWCCHGWSGDLHTLLCSDQGACQGLVTAWGTEGVEARLCCTLTLAADKEGEVGVEASVIKPTCVHHAPFLHQAKHVQDGSIRFVAWVCLIICNDKGWVHWGHKCDITYSAGSRPGYHSWAKRWPLLILNPF